MHSPEYILFAISLLLFFSILASKVSTIFGIPALLFFLAVGMFAGSDELGWINFDNIRSAQFIGILALIFILYSAGLDTEWQNIRTVLWSGLLLATVGVAVTAVIVGSFVHYVLSFSWTEGMLLGSIAASTDAAAVFSILRSKGLHLKGGVRHLIEFESASNDPMAVFLTLGIIRLITIPSTSFLSLAMMFVLQMVVGAGIGVGMGHIICWLVNRLHLDYKGLYPVMTIALVLFTYSLTTLLGGSGFLAVYLAGIIMGNKAFLHKRELFRFHDGLTWLVQIGMFLTLGLLVTPSRLLPVFGLDLLAACVLMFFARPISVFLFTAFSRFHFKEKVFVSWVGLRGAVPIVLASFPLVAAVPRAEDIFYLVFFIVCTSMLVQGTSIPWVVKWLGLSNTPKLDK